MHIYVYIYICDIPTYSDSPVCFSCANDLGSRACSAEHCWSRDLLHGRAAILQLQTSRTGVCMYVYVYMYACVYAYVCLYVFKYVCM
jgi:hypothetical protein